MRCGVSFDECPLGAGVVRSKYVHRQGIDKQAARRVAALWLMALVAACGGLEAAPEMASAGWEQTVAVHGPTVQHVVFDSHDTPWVAVGGEASFPFVAPFIARLTRDYRFADVQALPRIPGQQVTGVDEMAVNASGMGDLLLDYRPPPDPEDKVPPNGAAIAGWRPGHPIGRAIELAGDTHGGPSMAIGSSGTAVVLWASSDGVVDVARTRSGHLLGTQEIQIADGHVPNGMEVLPSPTAGFLASWSLSAGGTGQGASEFELVAVDSDVTSRTGVFGEPVLTPWPAHMTSALGVSEANIVSDARGDQVALWSVTNAGMTGLGEDIYVASRRAGKPFSASQFIGEGEFPLTSSRLVIGPTGRITVVWQRDRLGEILVAGGYAGHPLSTSHPIWDGGYGETESEPLAVMTTRGQVIASWAVEQGSPNAMIMAATSDDGLHFSKAQRISIGGRYIHGCGHPALLVPDRTGGVLAAWSCTYHRHQTINEYARYRP